MSDFPGESTELDRDERCPSSFLDPDLLPSEYESVIEDMSYPEVSWNAQDRYYMHPTLEQPVVCESDNERNEQVNGNSHTEIGDGLSFWPEATNVDATQQGESLAFVSDSLWLPDSGSIHSNIFEPVMESYNEEPWLYDSSNAGFIEPFPSVNTFDTDRGGNLMPTAYQQQLPEITNMPPVSSVPNLGRAENPENDLLVHQYPSMASSEFEQLDLEVPFHSSIFEDPHLMSNLDMYQPMQLPDENLVVSCQPLLLDFTSGQGDGANIVAETGVPFPLSQASADENPTFESHTGGLKEQPVRPIFGPSKPVELPPKSSRRKRESKARTKERKLRSVRRQACWKCRKDHKSCDGQTPCSHCIKTMSKARNLRQPCAKAYFSDLVLNGSYFEFSAHYQALVIQKQSDSDIATQLSILCELAKVNMDFVIKSSFRPGPRCLITWGAGVETLYNAVDQDFSNPRRFNAQLASKMVRALQRLHETVEGPLCFFEIPGKSLQSQHWLLACMFFYESGYWTIRAVENATFDAPVGFDAQAIKLALNLIIWFTMRRCEIEAFRYLERFVNDDISKSENDEIDNVIRVMARVLCIPSNFRIEADNISADANRDIDSDFHDFKDRHERVRAALFVYICILNSRRRTGVSLWDIFGSKKIVKQIKLEFHNCLENVDNLLSGFESWQQHILKKFQRFDTLRDNLEFLDSDENPLNTMLDDFEEDEKLFDDDEIRLAMKIARD